jgi:hypothetical protein
MPIFEVVIEHTELRFLCVTVDADDDMHAAAQVEQIIAECHRNPDDITARLQACWDTESGAVDVATVELASGSSA